jgi:hypothetical protein
MRPNLPPANEPLRLVRAEFGSEVELKCTLPATLKLKLAALAVALALALALEVALVGGLSASVSASAAAERAGLSATTLVWLGCDGRCRSGEGVRV